MLRGINQTQLFYDDEDRIAFMDRLKELSAGHVRRRSGSGSQAIRRLQWICAGSR
jgi:hypothetical protein